MLFLCDSLGPTPDLASMLKVNCRLSLRILFALTFRIGWTWTGRHRGLIQALVFLVWVVKSFMGTLLCASIRGADLVNHPLIRVAAHVVEVSMYLFHINKQW